MLVGFFTLIGLCLVEIIIAKWAIKDKNEHIDDFFKFFDIEPHKKDGKK